MGKLFLILATMIGLGVSGPLQAQTIQMVIVEQPGCAYCAAWDDQIAPAYPNTAEGRFAPLLRADLHLGPPEGIDYARRINFTPTFVIVRDGAEVARIEGYPGEDFFWPIFSKLLEDKTDFEPPRN